MSIIHGIWYFPQVFSSSCSKHWKHESNGLIHLCLYFSCQFPSSVLLGHGEGEGGGAEDPGEFQIPTLIQTNLVQTIGTFSGLQTLHLSIHYSRLSVVFIWIEGLIVMQNKIFWHFVMFLILFRHYIYMCTRLTILHLFQGLKRRYGWTLTEIHFSPLSLGEILVRPYQKTVGRGLQWPQI